MEIRTDQQHKAPKADTQIWKKNSTLKFMKEEGRGNQNGDRKTRQHLVTTPSLPHWRAVLFYLARYQSGDSWEH